MPRAVLFSGHMVDGPGRASPRFPATKEPLVRARIDAILDRWAVGKGDICICGGARGGDILFAEHCLALGAELRLFMPLPKRAFLDESVRLPRALDSDWENRFERILARAKAYWPPHPEGSEGPDSNPFSENNTRMMDHAIAVADGGPVHVLLLWDGKGGDGEGGTADVARRARESAAEVVIVDPTALSLDRA